MSVVLRIMSGARQGESVEFESDDFSVGGQPDCDVVFDPAEDLGTRGARVEFRCDENRWQARRVEGESVLINQDLLDTVLPIRSGDVIRMSPEGPDLRFLLIASSEEDLLAERMPTSAAVAASVGSETAATDEAMSSASDRAETGATSWRRPALAAAAVLMAALLVALFWAFWSPERVSEVKPPPPPPPTTPPPTPPVSVTPVTPPASPPPSTPPASTTPQTPTPPPISKPPVEPSPPIVILVAWSKVGYLPFGVAAAIEDAGGHQMLLTTARLADIMSEGYWRKSIRFSAALPGEPGEATRFVPIDGKGIFRHRLYVEAVNRGNLQGAAYFNVAILVCAEKLPRTSVGKVAARRAVAGIAPDLALSVWSVFEPPLPARTWSPPYEMKLAKVSCRVKETVPLDEEARTEDTPHVLTFDPGKKPLDEGSPVLNEAGEVVAICGKRPSSVASGSKSLAPAAVPVDTTLIGSLWEGHDGKQWVADYAARDSGSTQQPHEN